MTKIGKLFVGLVALILLWMLMLFFNWHRIETELKNASALVLDQAGYDQLEIDTDHQGRTVVLSGVMRSTENIDHATSLVAGIEGVHRVQTDSIELKPYSPANISLKSNQASITLLGSLSSDAVAKQLNGQITKAMGRRLDHGLSIDPDVESPPWLIGLATGVPALEPIDDLDFEIKDRKLRIAGISRDSASHQSALKAVSNLPGIQAADISGLVLKPFNPSWFALSDRSVRGTVSTAGESFRLKRLFADFAGVDDVTGIQVDSEFSSAEWLSDLERVVGNAGGVESPTISYRDGVIKVAGIVREQQDFDALAAQAPYLMHTRQLNLAEVELRPFQTPWLDMRVTEEKILLQGLVRQAKTANELLQNIANATGSTFEGQIENQLKVSTDVSPGEWAPAVGRLVAGMAKIELGSLLIKEDALTLNGIARENEVYQELLSASEESELTASVDTSGLALRPWKDPRFALSTLDSKAIASGRLGKEENAEILGQAIGLVFGAENSPQLLIDPDVTEAVWLNDVMRLLPAMSGLEEASLIANNEHIDLTGIARTQGAYALVENAVAESAAQNIRNTVSLRPWKQPELSVSNSGQGWVIMGLLKEGEVLRPLTDLGAQLGLSMESSVKFDPDVTQADWMEDVLRLLPTLRELEESSLVATDAEVDVGGIARTEELYGLIAQTISSATSKNVINNVALRPWKSPVLEMSSDNNALIMAGLLGNEGALTDLTSQANALASSKGFSLESSINVDPDVTDAEWIDDVIDLLPALSDLEDAALVATDEKLDIDGIARTRETFEQLEKTLETAQSKNIQNNVALRPWKKPVLEISAESEALVMAGLLGNEGALGSLNTQVSALGGSKGLSVETSIDLDPDVTKAEWINDVIGLLPALGDLEQASLRATDSDIEVAGIARTQVSFETLEKAINSSVSSKVINSVALRPWKQPALAIISEEDVLIVTGLLPDENARKQLDTQVSALGSAMGLSTSTSVDLDTDVFRTNWLAPVMQAIPTLSDVKDPVLIVKEGVVSLNGQVPDQSQRETIGVALSSAAEGLDLQNNIIVVPPVVIETGAGSVGIAQEEIDQCEESLDALLTDRNIEFASASAALSPSSTPILIALIKAINNCPEVVVEVSGHTDSSGNSAANLVLSDNRARAVVDYLVAAGVAPSRLEAEGYGSTQPVADNSTAQGRAQNRRIEFNIKMKR